MNKYTIEEFIITENINLYNKEHQDAVLKIATGLQEYIKKHKQLFIVSIETRAVEDAIHSERVDVIVSEINTNKISIMIDVFTGIKTEIAYEKLRRIKLGTLEPDVEIFVFEYKTKQWFPENPYSLLLGTSINLLTL